MRYLAPHEVIELHRLVLADSGGMPGIRDMGAVDSAVAQPRMTFGGQELYPTVVEKAAALAFSLVRNHPFIDGNKRTGHAAMETFLVLNLCRSPKKTPLCSDKATHYLERKSGCGQGLRCLVVDRFT